MVVQNNLQCAHRFANDLRTKTKEQVFAMWSALCLGRIHCATIKEQRKGWMIYDIIRAKFGAAVADQVA